MTELEVEAIANRCIKNRTFQMEELATLDAMLEKSNEVIISRLNGIDARLKPMTELTEFMIQEKAKKGWVQDARSSIVALATVASALFVYAKLL